MSFQKIILIIAIILLIITLIIIGVVLYNKKHDDKYPPVQSECPDYWEVTKTSDGKHVCDNTKKMGNTNCPHEMNFNESPFVGSKGQCNKQKWARTCELTWDGITNASGIC